MSINENNNFRYSIKSDSNDHNNQTMDLIQRPLNPIHSIEDTNIIQSKIEIIITK